MATNLIDTTPVIDQAASNYAARIQNLSNIAAKEMRRATGTIALRISEMLFPLCHLMVANRYRQANRPMDQPGGI